MRAALVAVEVVLGIATLLWRRLDDALLRWTLPPRPIPWRFLTLLAAMGTALLVRASQSPAFDGRTHCHFHAQSRLEERMRALEAAPIPPAPAGSGR